ncbi:MAG: asparagine synthase (glutamine-hydrolyzing) [Blastocatellia bacterium]
MCGICGVAASKQSRQTVDPDRLARMTDSLTHRGPDDRGTYVTHEVGLGHRRLSIVDIGGGHQPMANHDESIWIVFNGEIYNHVEIRSRLEARGHTYRTNSDTETIIHLYEEMGDRVAEELRVMFAFAIYDAKSGAVLLVRDRLGIKPLYYSIDEDGTLYFGSEIKAILEYGGVKARLNSDVVPDFLANRAPSGEETLFSGIKRLLPAHILRWNHGRVSIERYWKAPFDKAADPLSNESCIDGFSDLFQESVRLHLMSDVPLGMFLSGGIDSSAIAAAMAENVPHGIKTFSVAFSEIEANELEYARLVAKAYGADHHEIVVSPRQFFDALPSLIYHEDEPIAHPSSVPLYFVSKLAAEHVKVVLTGEGSDELLAGYDKYRKTIYNLKLGYQYRRMTPETVRTFIRHLIKTRLPYELKRKLVRTFLCVEPDLESAYFDNFSVFSRDWQDRLLPRSNGTGLARRDPYRHALDAISDSGAGGLLEQLLAADLGIYLHELLMKQDQMSMAASIESRVPFLDHKLVEFACRLPAHLKLNGLTTKYVLRRAMQGKLPDAILKRKKMGFPVPLRRWLAGPFTHLLDEYILSSRARKRGMFDPAAVSDLVAGHRQGEDHTERLWTLLNFEIWMRRFIDADDSTRRIPSRRLTLAAAAN